MSHYSELIKDEIQLAKDECCIVFDFGCYFPYSNFEELAFDFTLGMEEFDDYKINHRYPNKGYQTISKKYGRKVSKVGYPYIMKISEQSMILLCFKIGIKDNHISLIFPIITSMTKDQPVCALTLHYMFDKSEIYFMSCEKTKNRGYCHHIWRNCNSENEARDNEILLNAPRKIDDSNTLIYEDIIAPYPSSLEDLLL